MIDWETRLKNKAFWVALIPAVLLLVQVVAVPFGYKFDISGLNKNLLDIVNAIFSILTILGVVIDPTSGGVSDNQPKAQTTEMPEPLPDDEEKGGSL